MDETRTSSLAPSATYRPKNCWLHSTILLLFPRTNVAGVVKVTRASVVKREKYLLCETAAKLTPERTRANAYYPQHVSYLILPVEPFPKCFILRVNFRIV